MKNFTTHRDHTAGLLRPYLLAACVLMIHLISCEALAQVVVAHAGGKTHGPENTLPTISTSFDLGADWVEVDVRLTLDAVAMLMHDADVDRTTDGTGLLGSMTMSEVKMLDAGSYFGPEFSGTEVPTFQEALAAALGRGPILVDMKDSFVGAQVADALTSLGAGASDIVLWVTGQGEIAEAQAFLPGSRIFFQTQNGSEAHVQFVADQGVDGISILYQALTPSAVALGHALGLEVYVWGANSRARMAEVLFYGADGIHHADPGFVLDFLSEDDCNDDADNDQDGFSDFPDDPGCTSLTDNSEKSSLVCDDGVDNDGDGLVDFPYDPDCASLLDPFEAPIPVPFLTPFGWALLALCLVAVAFPYTRVYERANGQDTIRA